MISFLLLLFASRWTSLASGSEAIPPPSGGGPPLVDEAVCTLVWTVGWTLVGKVCVALRTTVSVAVATEVSLTTLREVCTLVSVVGNIRIVWCTIVDVAVKTVVTALVWTWTLVLIEVSTAVVSAVTAVVFTETTVRVVGLLGSAVALHCASLLGSV